MICGELNAELYLNGLQRTRFHAQDTSKQAQSAHAGSDPTHVATLARTPHKLAWPADTSKSATLKSSSVPRDSKTDLVRTRARQLSTRTAPSTRVVPPMSRPVAPRDRALVREPEIQSPIGATFRGVCSAGKRPVT